MYVYPQALYLHVLDPMRSGSFFHWCPWIRAYKLMRAVLENNTDTYVYMYVHMYVYMYVYMHAYAFADYSYIHYPPKTIRYDATRRK